VKAISKSAILFLFLITLLASCNNFAYAPNIKATEAMKTSIVEARTSIFSTLKAVPTITQMPTETETPSPSPTWDAIRKTQESWIATNWAPVYATLDSRGVQCKDGYFLEVPEVIDRNSNPIWSIYTCSPQAGDYHAIWTPGSVDYSKRYTVIQRTDLSKNWVISHKDFPWSNRPNAYLRTYAWDRDGNFVYVVPATSPGPGGGSMAGLFRSSNELYRISLNTGKLETILPFAIEGYSYSLSPDGNYLAYSILEEENIIHIRNFKNNDEHLLKLKDDYVRSGAFVWTPDGKTLIFASAIKGWEEGTAGISIFALAMKDLYLQIILFNDERQLIPFAKWRDGKFYYWTEKNFLFVHSLKYMSVEYFSELALDIQSGNVSVISTPHPQLIGSATPKP